MKLRVYKWNRGIEITLKVSEIEGYTCHRGGILLWGCTSGEVGVPCIYSHAGWEWLLQAIQILVAVFVWPLSSANVLTAAAAYLPPAQCHKPRQKSGGDRHSGTSRDSRVAVIGTVAQAETGEWRWPVWPGRPYYISLQTELTCCLRFLAASTRWRHGSSAVFSLWTKETRQKCTHRINRFSLAPVSLCTIYYM